MRRAAGPAAILLAILAASWLLVIVQTSTAPAFPLFGVGPNLLLAALCCWAIERGPLETALAAAVSGILMGLLSFQGMAESVAALAPIALAAIWWSEARPRHGAAAGWPAAAALAAVASALHFTAHAVAVELETTGVNWIEAVRDVMLPGAAADALIALALYWPLRWSLRIARPLGQAAGPPAVLP